MAIGTHKQHGSMESLSFLTGSVKPLSTRSVAGLWFSTLGVLSLIILAGLALILLEILPGSLVLPLIVAIAAASPLGFAISLWHKAKNASLGRVHFMVLALAVGTVIIWINYWHLSGLNFSW